MASRNLLFKTLLVSATLTSIRSHMHPQCTDSYPPFEEVNAQYCSQYQDFGCCVAERDLELENLSASILDNFPEEVRGDCGNFVRDILCQECSPYAAHVFNIEGNSRTDWSDFPGLCTEYCRNFHKTCGQLLPYITRSKVLLNASAVSTAAFCESQMIDDMNYCFPDVLNNTVLNDQVRESQIGSSDNCLCLEEFANNLRNPLALTFANDSTHRIYVVEQTGVVTIFFRNGSYLYDPFLDIQDLVYVLGFPGDERGLLGLAFHPNYAENRQFYIHYTTRFEGVLYVRISELKSFPNDSNIADPRTERVLIQVRQPAGNHNGGSLFFDLEGYLYISLGDGGIAGDPFGEYGNGLNLTTFLGKILRIDVNGRDGSLPYAIPPDNPFVQEDPEIMFHEIFAYGVRNMWRCSVDRGDSETGEGAGRIFCGDVGQNRYEEIDIIVNGGNYGWRAMEGNSCFDGNLCNEEFIGDNYVEPIHVYSRDVGRSVTGGHVYRGCLYPNLQGLYIYGDFANGRLFKLEENGADWTNTEICLGSQDICTGSLTNFFPQNILSFGEDEAGEVYMLVTDVPSSTHTGGKIYRFVDPNKRGNPEECQVEERPDPVFGSITPSIDDVSPAEGQYYGKLIGFLNTEEESSQSAVGTLYAVDETHVYIRGFTFDGDSFGTDARFFAGSSDGPDETGVIIPDGRGITTSLGAYNNQNLLLTLPDDTTLSTLSWIAVWDVNIQSDYGSVIFPSDLVPPVPYNLGEFGFVPRVHNVHADTVIIENSKQFTFVNLDYDGFGPAAYFWTGKGVPDGSDRRVADPNGNIERRLPSYRGVTVTITLPEDLTVFDIDYIGIWCELAFQDFGNVPITDEDRDNIPPFIEVPELPQQGCVELLENRYQVSWELSEPDNKITFQLKGRVSLNEYMAFGISGSETGTLMVGSDVSVVWIDPSTSEAQGEDYYLTAYSQCVVNSAIGACPDTFSFGDNNVLLLGAEVQDGIVVITFERPLIPGDPFDKPIPTDRPVFISWSLGFINGIGLVSRHHTRTPGDLSIHFGDGGLNCPDFTPLSDGPILDPWVIDPLVTYGDDTFVAFIGPTGGLRGYQGLTGQIGWGIAWYINSSLIPEIYVYRGSTYRFEVYGGDDNTNVASYHPLYITDSSEGGYGQKLPEEQEEEVIYAGPVEGSLCEYVNSFGVNPDDFEDFYEYMGTLLLNCPENSEPGILEWTVADDTPDVVYYQCYVHRYLGWKIHVLNPEVTTTEVITDEALPPIVYDCPIEASTVVPLEVDEGPVLWREPSSTNLQEPVVLSFFTHRSGDSFAVGVTVVIYVFTSLVNGDQATCTFPVFVEQDFPSPLSVFQCPSDTEITLQPGQTSGVVTYQEPFAVDTIRSENLLQSQTCTSGSRFFVGTTFCEYTFSDSFGNTASCSFIVDVLTVQNACTPNPCQNGGSCTPIGTSFFTCRCATGFTGTSCTQIQNACTPNPCQNGGSCTPIGTSGFICRCVTGFSGTTCSQIQRACDSTPCQNGGTCFSLGTTQFICFCPFGTSGSRCEQIQNACTINPCQNGGSCTPIGTSLFICGCVTGFTGTTCTQIQNACTINPCQNGGSCTPIGTSLFICGCVTGFTGTTCTQIQNACTINPCQNGGSCTPIGTSFFICTCVTGFTGTTCTQSQNACTINPCQNGGSCTAVGTSGFTCRCVTGFTGTTCSQQAVQSACDPSPCQNGGACFSFGPTLFLCICPAFFSGNRCEQSTLINPCTPNPCQNGGSCTLSGTSGFTCRCATGFTGTTCTQIQNACTQNPCQNGGSCTPIGTSGFICSCATGFTGITCTQVQRACDSSPCQNGGTCFSLGPVAFICFCPETFSGTRCEQIQNACTINPCENGGSCTPIGTSGFTCRCVAGFTGTTCTQIQNACTPNPCQNSGSCTLNGISGFTCRCVSGFTGTTCTQIQSGCDSSPCLNDGICISLGPLNFICICTPPFSGTRCEGIQNACTPNPCQNGGSCTPIGTSFFTCRCATGFTGTSCTQIQNACTPNPCQNGGLCTLSGTSGFTCRCATGFTGTTCTQTQRACDSSPCQNGGTCISLGPVDFFCFCPGTFSGTRCEQILNACTINPCENGGSCTAIGTSGFTCRCVTGFTGTTCTQIQNACTPNPCQNGGSCTLSGTSGFTCRCSTGFTGTTCTQIQSACDPSPCQNGGTCFSFGPALFFCLCPASTSGSRCEQILNACTQNPCQNGGSCTAIGTSGFTCRCVTGFTGTTCTQIQNACTPNPCRNGGSCTLSGTSGFTCRCATGFTGTTCTQIQSACDPSPCQNGGTCFSLGPALFFCLCPASTSGSRCEQIQNACTQNPCQNGGSCTPIGTSFFTCRCATGFTGTSCTQIQNACTQNPCQNGGSCTPIGTSGFTCRCVTGFTGTTCTQIQNACTPNPCQNGGSCFPLGGTNFVCICPVSFSGTTCGNIQNACTSSPCQNGGSCTPVGTSDFTCRCVTGFTGTTCTQIQNACTPNPCQNEGSCFVLGVSNFVCICPVPFSGTTCDDVQNACTPNPCQNGGSCTLGGTGGFTCRCVTGFTGTTCTQIQNACTSNPCQNGGSCTPIGTSGFTCRCVTGFTGTTCTQIQNACTPNPCQNGGSCFVLGGSNFVCICPVPFSGTTCDNVQNACSSNPCQNGGSCTLSGTSGFTCRCVTGFTGTTCTQIQNACTPNPCQNGGSCTLSGTSGFTCRCVTGFTGTTCTQIQNACTPNPCQNGGSCTPIGTSGFICRCVTGFTGTICTQIQNACTPSPCQNGGSCTPVGTSGFTCTCVTGFTGTTCTQIQNACTPNPCQNGGSCTLSGTSGFTCRCATGFTGTTCTQIQNACTPNPCQNGGSCTLSGTSGFICRCVTGFTGTTCTQMESQLQNCPDDDLMFGNFDIITWTEPTHSGGSLIYQSRAPGGEFAIGRTTVVYTFDVNGRNETCEFDVVVGEDPNSGDVLPVLEFSLRTLEEEQSFSLTSSAAAVISCTVTATDNYTPEIMWYKDDRLLRSGENRIYFGENGRFLIIFPPFNSEDAGLYRCEASIPSEAVSGFMEITVTFTE